MPGSFSNDMTLVEDAEVTTDYSLIGTLKSARALNDDQKLEGANAMTWGVSSATGTGTAHILGNLASAVDFSSSGAHFFQWIKCVAWPSMDTHAQGGTRIAISSDAPPTAVRATLKAVVSAGGSGYAVNDELSLSGGTTTETAVFVVKTLSGSAVATVSPKATARGDYTVLPTNPVSTTGGGGSGCTLTVTWIYSTTNTKEWFIGGSDTVIVDGWVNYVVDVAGTPDLETGAPVVSSIDRMGVGATAVAVSKLATHTMDVSRYGTGITVNDGTAGSPVTMEDVRAYDNNNARALGVVVAQNDIFFLAGKLRIGTAVQTAVTVFKDTNQVYVYQGFPVSASFYEITLAGAGSFATTFQLGNFSGGVASGGCTIRGARRYTHYAGVATGLVIAIWKLTADGANTTCLLYGCTFTQMKSALLRSNSAVRFCTFQDFGTITPGGALIDNCTFLDLRTTSPISAVYAIIVGGTVTPTITNCKFINCATAIAWSRAVDTDGVLDGCSFVSGGTGHAIEFDSNTPGDPTELTLRDVSFSGYGADGTTDAAIYNNSAKHLIINIVGGTTPTVRNGASASTTLIVNPVDTTITVKDANTSLAIQDARVLVQASDGTGPLPFEETVTITRSGLTATVSHTAHGLATGDKVKIKGADQPQYNSVKTITVTGNDSYTYTVTGSPATPATGAIKATGVVIEGLTNASGVITDNRPWASAQPVTGRARKAKVGELFYQTGAISGTISTSAGFSLTLFLLPDE